MRVTDPSWGGGGGVGNLQAHALKLYQLCFFNLELFYQNA